ncbi:porphobilinogen synthase [Helicobacter turcicus]|uniref:Delta-aminolevulinic acid dehydratase n=1 Tax=Helicobacter turcicus TaxID=2867412 RepID=A0ABS7JNR0_9HELI|nr:porphobilinogen synthase [Helicobacter turcicus]MBX7491043.1 porphobilinogen synthase [Helicobacter turcicus]MBX7546304.1 porphobilinogen synthase [Helicobacter turcicus]
MFKRLRRVRLNSIVRNLVEENNVRTQDLIYPLFIVHGKNIKNSIASMPDVYQLSIDNALKECAELELLGINAVMLFGIPSLKDSVGSEALSEQGIIAQALRAIKAQFPNLLLCVDLCFCEYTDHGHCGILNPKLQSVDNDLTLEILNKQALILAKAGADLIAPSGMLDGMILSLRQALDNAGFSHIPLMSYSTKFASGYYGPFRDVAQSTPSFGDRKSYQQNPANRREAILESLEDEAQGADILMVKPALAYLDIVRDIREKSLLPLAVYNVSGEYAMLKLAQKAGLIDYERVLMETILSFKRAGADIIITYHAKEIAKLLKV